jgi:hypothetical protein
VTEETGRCERRINIKKRQGKKYREIHTQSRRKNQIKTEEKLKGSVFWDITQCSPMKVNRRFRGTCRLHLQG